MQTKRHIRSVSEATAVRHIAAMRKEGDLYLPCRKIRAVFIALLSFLFLQSVAIAQIPRAALQYRDSIIRNARFVWGMNGPIATIAGQIATESGWRADAHSIYAEGLAEFTPETAQWISKLYRDKLGEAEPYNPQWAIRALNLYDKYLFDRISKYDSHCDRYLFVLSDYNGGSKRRMDRQKLSKSPGNWSITSRINPKIGASNQKENQEYPWKIVYKHQPLYLSWGQGVCNG